MRVPRNLYRPLAVHTEETLQDLFVRFGNALSPQLYHSEPSPTRRIPARNKFRPGDIQTSITRHHHAQRGGVFVLELLRILGTAASEAMSNPLRPASGPTSIQPTSL